MYNSYKNKVYLILSKWCYPFGGGEEFMLQTMMWAHELGMDCYWISLCDKANKYFDKLEIECYEFGKLIKIPNGDEEDNIIKYWLKMLKPSMVHHQGHMRKKFYEICDSMRIEFLTGFHFWIGAIILNEKTLNIDIMENKHLHNADQEISYLWNKKYCNYYAVTEFVANCINEITNYDIKDIIYASSSILKCKIENFDILKNNFVTMINIHKLKGGEILLHLIKNLLNIPFMAVITEPGSEELDHKISKAIEDRKKTNGIECIIIKRINDPKIIYQQTKILLVGSICDETFCRVVNEGMMNGIPIITTGKGNIKYLLGDSGIIINENNLSDWTNKVSSLYFDNKLLTILSMKSLTNYENYSEEKAKLQFKNVIGKILTKNKENNLMIICPWCDQGLGILSRTYARILQEWYNVYIFSLKPYNANSCIELQKNPMEWEWQNIYYSKNDRENVKDSEIINFVIKNNIGKCILPETCWSRVFEIAKLLRDLDVKCYAVPMIEIVRKDEISKHNYFYKILCSNYLCVNIFGNYGILKTQYVGYGINDPLIKMNPTVFKKNDIIKFLFIGGMNAFSRKQILNICESFFILNKTYKSFSLTCTIQKINLLESEDKENILKYFNHPCFTFIDEHLTYEQIINLYYEHHISIQVSKHEGLGLGFYEALSTGTPIITLNVPPHNEIVIDNVNGWTIESFFKKMEDNKDGLIGSAYFDPQVLSQKLSDIVSDFYDTYNNIIAKLINDHNNRLNNNNFKQKLYNSILN